MRHWLLNKFIRKPVILYKGTSVGISSLFVFSCKSGKAHVGHWHKKGRHNFWCPGLPGLDKTEKWTPVRNIPQENKKLWESN